MSSSPWHLEIFIGLAISSMFVARWLFRETNLLVATLFAYIMIYGSYKAVLPATVYPNYGLVTIFQLKESITHSVLWLLALVVPYMISWDYLDRRTLKTIGLCFLVLGIVNALFMLKVLIPGLDAKAIQLNEAQDGTLLACLLPLSFSIRTRLKWPVIAILVAGIVVSDSSTAYLGLFVAVTSYLVLTKKYNLAGLFAVMCLGAAYLHQGEVLLNGNGRYDVWKMSMQFFNSKVNHIIGTGPGTYFIYGPQLQIQAYGPQTANVFVWMHNEWLQVIFELGLTGLVLCISAFISALNNLKTYPVMFACLLTYGLTALTQMPVHQLASAYFGVFLLVVAFRKPLF